MNKIQIKNISVQKNEKYILKPLSLEIEENEILIIQGSSGAGKSTLLKCILLFEHLNSGEVVFNNQTINENNVSDYRIHFTYISQKLPYYYGSVKEFLNFPFKFKSNKSLILSNKDLEYYFKKLCLDLELLEKQYNKLSDGEKQRICITQSLLLKRKFILLDEATSNLDSKNKERVVKLFKEKNITVIAVSHDHCWDSVYTRKLIMEDGRIIEEIRK